MNGKELRKTRRKFIKFSLSAITTIAISPGIFAQTDKKTQIIGSRMFASSDFTRVTIESNSNLEYKYFTLENPLRFVVDIEGIEVQSELKEIALKSLLDPFVSELKIGINRPNVTRLVFLLREKIKPQVFTLAPEGNFGHRLVLDIYPKISADVTFINSADNEREKKRSKLKEKKENKKMFVVAIDAGHGGADPGAIGANGTYEKDITISIAKKLKEELDKIPWMQGVLIRKGDYFIPLRKRVERAKASKADIFISIHADAALNREAKGSSVYVLSEKGASSATSKWLEERENNADSIGEFNIKNINNDGFLARTLFDLSLSATITDSTKLAGFILDEMGKINDLHKKQIESAGFAVLKSHNIPSVLIETAFISNREEERKLKNSKYQDKIVDAIILGIKKYNEKLSNN